MSVTRNCVPACLSCNGSKGDSEALSWYRRQAFYDPRRAMALRAWMEGDMELALHLLRWVHPCGEQAPGNPPRRDHQTLQPATPLWRWQMAS